MIYMYEQGETLIKYLSIIYIINKIVSFWYWHVWLLFLQIMEQATSSFHKKFESNVGLVSIHVSKIN